MSEEGPKLTLNVGDRTTTHDVVLDSLGGGLYHARCEVQRAPCWNSAISTRAGVLAQVYTHLTNMMIADDD